MQPLQDGKLVHQGWSPQCESGPVLSESDWGALKTTAIQDGSYQPEHNKRLPETLEPKVRLEVNAGDLLMTCAGPRVRCGVACLVRETPPKRFISGKMYRFRANEALIDSRLLEAFLRIPSTKAQIDAMKTGISESGMNITHEKFSQLIVPIAPRAEQNRIADKLDTVLTSVDAVNTRLARVAPLLKRFRQSVLAAATSGRLTEDWRGDLEQDWATHKLGDLLEGKPRNGYSPKAVDYETPVRSLTLSATTSGTFKGEHAKYIDEEIPDDSHLWLEPDDILIQRANSLEYVGVSAIFNGPEKSFIYPDLMMKARANTRTTSRFLHLLLCAEGTRKYFRENATGTAGNMPKINQQTVINAPCRLPTLAEQTEIVRRVETLFAFADRLQARLAQAQTAATRLTPALLAKAFRGELVPQDPNDEPAAELLRRLQAQRATGAPASKTGAGRGRGRKAVASAAADL